QWLRSAAPTPAWRYLPHRKRSADIIGRCAEYTEGEAAAYKAEQHGRFHAIDLLPVDVRLVGEVGHGNSPCNTLPALSPSNYLVICIGGCDRGNTKRPARSANTCPCAVFSDQRRGSGSLAIFGRDPPPPSSCVSSLAPMSALPPKADIS